MSCNLIWLCRLLVVFTCHFFFFNATATTEIYTLSLHDALPISIIGPRRNPPCRFAHTTCSGRKVHSGMRSEEHTSELQSHSDLVCRLLLEKKKITTMSATIGPADPISHPSVRASCPRTSALSPA